MGIEKKDLRVAFGKFATGVTVVTTRDSHGAPVGFTASSFTSVSLDPAMLLICMSQHSRSYDAMTNAAGFAVNILSENQKPVSDNFSLKNHDRFENADWKSGPSGYPLLDGCAAWFECQRQNMIKAGDHIILIGKVTGFDSLGHAPLILSQSKFL
ncbi:MAG: flavin reductase family protein [Rhodobacteraceae bacterium]|nr:flavin reductase family protein [Paracoccaceae bacterium]